MQKYEPMSQLKAKRIEKNLTQQQLSDLVGIRQNLLSCYESGIYFPRRKVLDKLAKALECEVKDIVGGETMDKKLTDKNKQDKDGELLLTFDSFMKLFDAYIAVENQGIKKTLSEALVEVGESLISILHN